MEKPRVYVVGFNPSVESLFEANGISYIRPHEVDKVEPDLVCFTGGSDVNPTLYGEDRLKGTFIDEKRDAFEVSVFKKYEKIPKVGICRGGQFLNVMAGGAMWQDVTHHTQDHFITDLLFGENKLVWVTSTHHQMMIPAPDGELIAVCDPPRSQHYLSSRQREKPEVDTEVVWYERTNSLCFQPHPEYMRSAMCTKYFFDLIQYFWGK